MYPFNQRSLDNIVTCHPDIQVLAFAVAKHRNCSALSGRRGKEEQNYLRSTAEAFIISSLTVDAIGSMDDMYTINDILRGATGVIADDT